MSVKFIFDVDGTLTLGRQGMNGEFQGYFIDFCYANEVYLVTSSDYAKTLEHLGPDVCDAVMRIYSSNGNNVWEKGVNIHTNEHILPENADKAQIIEDFAIDDILYFFGDNMTTNGNNYLLSLEVEFPNPVTKWQDTFELLKRLQKTKVAGS
jgi:hypothetical protein